MVQASKRVDKNLLERLYIIEKKSATEIGRNLDVSDSSVRKWLRHYSIPVRGVAEATQLISEEGMPSKEELERLYIEENHSAKDLSKIFGVKHETLRKWLVKLNIPIRGSSETAKMRSLKIPSKEVLIQDYQGHTLKELAKKHNTTEVTAKKWFKERGIPLRSKQETIDMRFDSRPPKEELKRLYLQEEQSTPEIARRYGTNHSTVRRWLERYQIPVRKATDGVRLKLGVKLPSKNELKRLYQKDKLSTEEIAERYNATTHTVRKWLKINDIPVRSYSEELRLKTRPSRKELERLYVHEKKSMKEICTELSKTPSTIRRWILDSGIELRSQSEEYRILREAKTPPKKTLERLYIDQRMTGESIGDKYDVTGGTVFKWLRQYGIPIRKFSDAIRKRVPSKAELKREYFEKNRTVQTLAKHYNVCDSTARNWLRQREISLRTHSENLMIAHGTKIPTKEELQKEYGEKGKSLKEIAKKFNTSQVTVKKWLDEHGVHIRSIGETTRLRFDIKEMPSKEELERLYNREQLSSTNIAEFYHCTPNTITRLMKSYGIPIRDMSEWASLKRGKVPSKEELKRLYSEEKKSSKEIGDMFDVSGNTVSGWLDKNGIKKRTKEETIKLRAKKRPSKEELEKLYFETRSSIKVAKKLGIGNATAIKWLEAYGIDRMTPSEKSNLNKPSKEELERLYVHDRLSTIQIGKKIGINYSKVSRWMKEYEIPLRDPSEQSDCARGIIRPSKEELEKLYIDEMKSAKEIGEIHKVGGQTVGRWLENYGISLRNRSDVNKLRYGLEVPSKEELERLYVHDKKSMKVLGKMYGTSGFTVGRWLDNYGIPRFAQKRFIKNSGEFRKFLVQNKDAQSLVALALNESGGYVEQTLVELFPERFKDKNDLHKLVESSKEEIKELINEGITNLGPYLGELTIEDRNMIPVLMGSAMNSIPVEKVTPSLEDRFTYMIRNTYGPKFNENPEGVIGELEMKLHQSEGFARIVYQRALDHYQSTVELREELACLN